MQDEVREAVKVLEQHKSEIKNLIRDKFNFTKERNLVVLLDVVRNSSWKDVPKEQRTFIGEEAWWHEEDHISLVVKYTSNDAETGDEVWKFLEETYGFQTITVDKCDPIYLSFKFHLHNDPFEKK